MLILRELHSFRNCKKVGPLLELCQDCAPQIAYELSLLSDVRTRAAFQRLFRG